MGELYAPRPVNSLPDENRTATGTFAPPISRLKEFRAKPRKRRLSEQLEHALQKLTVALL